MRQFVTKKLSQADLDVLNAKRPPCALNQTSKAEQYQASVAARLRTAGKASDPAAVDWYMMEGEPPLPGDKDYDHDDDNIESANDYEYGVDIRRFGECSISLLLQSFANVLSSSCAPSAAIFIYS